MKKTSPPVNQQLPANACQPTQWLSKVSLSDQLSPAYTVAPQNLSQSWQQRYLPTCELELSPEELLFFLQFFVSACTK